MKMTFSISEFKNKSVHIVGVTGSEGSAILRFLKKEQFENITVHDYTEQSTLEKSFKVWHKGMSNEARNAAFTMFVSDIKSVHTKLGREYLTTIESADLVFVPQSWRLYKEQNTRLFKIASLGVPFYSLTSLYLDLSPAHVIAVTGTVGKGSVSHLIFKILQGLGKKVYFGGNDTWNMQPLEKIREMTTDSYLVLEISHRQLQEGIGKAPHIGVFTNLYPNHLDEMSFEEYTKLKYSLFLTQSASDYAVLNKDIKELIELSSKIKSKIIFFSPHTKELNTKYVQEIYSYFKRNKSVHYMDNILAVSSVMEILSIPYTRVITLISKLIPPPARIQQIGTRNGTNWYDDIKSTTPWATFALIRKLGKRIILIMGGKTKGIDYHNALVEIQKNVSLLIILESELSQEASRFLKSDSFRIVKTLPEALILAGNEAKNGDTIAVSPGAGFFYTDFIKGKSSLHKLFESYQKVS